MRNTLGNHLSERIGVVGVTAHNVAMRVGVEITDGESLHMCKHLIPDILQNAL